MSYKDKIISFNATVDFLRNLKIDKRNVQCHTKRFLEFIFWTKFIWKIWLFFTSCLLRNC